MKAGDVFVGYCDRKDWLAIVSERRHGGIVHRMAVELVRVVVILPSGDEITGNLYRAMHAALPPDSELQLSDHGQNTRWISGRVLAGGRSVNVFAERAVGL